MRFSSGIALAALACSLALPADSGEVVPYPAGYRTWAVTRSFIAKEGPNSGFHHYDATDAGKDPVAIAPPISW
jgi:hypothetical protein